MDCSTELHSCPSPSAAGYGQFDTTACSCVATAFMSCDYSPTVACPPADAVHPYLMPEPLVALDASPQPAMLTGLCAPTVDQLLTVWIGSHLAATGPLGGDGPCDVRWADRLDAAPCGSPLVIAVEGQASAVYAAGGSAGGFKLAVQWCGRRIATSAAAGSGWRCTTKVGSAWQSGGASATWRPAVSVPVGTVPLPPQEPCVDDAEGALAASGASCDELAGSIPCGTDLHTTDGALPAGLLLSAMCPASCGGCAAEHGGRAVGQTTLDPASHTASCLLVVRLPVRLRLCLSLRRSRPARLRRSGCGRTLRGLSRRTACTRRSGTRPGRMQRAAVEPLALGETQPRSLRSGRAACRSLRRPAARTH